MRGRGFPGCGFAVTVPISAKSETKCGPCRQGHAVLVESCRESDRIRKRDAKYCRRLRFRLKLTQRQVSSAGAQNTQREMMRRLRIEREKQRPNESFVGAGRASFADAELAEDGSEHVLCIDCSNHFADRVDRGVEIDREIFRRCSFGRICARALERFLRAPQTIAMPRVDRDRALRAQIFLRDALDNFLFQVGEAFVRSRTKSAMRRSLSNRHAPAGRSCLK